MNIKKAKAKAENAKKAKREIESEEAETIYNDSVAEATGEYDYGLYSSLREEVIEKINNFKFLAKR